MGFSLTYVPMGGPRVFASEATSPVVGSTASATPCELSKATSEGRRPCLVVLRWWPGPDTPGSQAFGGAPQRTLRTTVLQRYNHPPAPKVSPCGQRTEWSMHVTPPKLCSWNHILVHHWDCHRDGSHTHLGCAQCHSGFWFSCMSPFTPVYPCVCVGATVFQL